MKGENGTKPLAYLEIVRSDCIYDCFWSRGQGGRWGRTVSIEDGAQFVETFGRPFRYWLSTACV
jgi:hypothetical protein